MHRRQQRLVKTGLISLLFFCLGAPLACWWTVTFFDLSLPSARRLVSAPPTPVAWTGLPSPKVIHQNWTSFTNADSIRGAVTIGPLLWAATDGGAVVWDTAKNASVKFTAEHGLASNRLTGVAAAPDGSLWFGAHTGLSRYDGANWTTFTTQNGLANDDVRDIVIRLDGVVWVATAGGVNAYDGYDWKTHTSGNTFFGLISDDVRDIVLSPKGVWAVTPVGVSFHDGDQWQAYNYPDKLGGEEVFAAAAAPDGSIWIGTGVGLRHFDGATWERLTVRDGLIDNAVHALAVTNDGAVWIGYGEAGDGLTRWDGFTVQTFTIADGLADDRVQSLNVGETGELWVGTARGLSRFDGVSWKTFIAPSEIPTHNVRSLLAARKAVWAAGESGVSRYDNTGWRLFTTADGLVADDVYALAIGPDGSPLAAYETPSSGLSHLTGANVWESLPCRPTPLSANVNAGAEAPDGSVWFATDEGVSRYHNSEWRTFVAADGLPDDIVRTLVVAPDGAVWIGAARGLAFFSEDRWQIVAGDDVRLLTTDSSGGLWAATPQGVARLVNGELISLPDPPSADIRALVAFDNAVWIATPVGVGRYQDQQWQTFTTADGLASNDPQTLVLGKDNWLWVGFADVSLGFSYFERGRWQTFPPPAPKDNHLPLQGKLSTMAVAADSSVWFGTTAGEIRQYFTQNPSDNFYTQIFNRSPISDIVATKDGSLWLTSRGRGAARWDGERWHRFAPAPTIKTTTVQSLTVTGDGTAWIGATDGVVQLSETQCAFNSKIGNTNVLAVAPEASGGVWVGTEADGAIRYSSDGLLTSAKKQTGEFAPLLATTPNGVLWLVIGEGVNRGNVILRLKDSVAPDGRRWERLALPANLVEDGITGLVVAPNNVIWAGTRRGVVYFEKGEWKTLTNADGLADNTLLTLLAAPDGTVWFATPGGLSRYRP